MKGVKPKKKKQKHLKSNEKRSHPFRIWQIVYVSIFALFLLIFQSSAEKKIHCIEFYMYFGCVLNFMWIWHMYYLYLYVRCMQHFSTGRGKK